MKSLIFGCIQSILDNLKDSFYNKTFKYNFEKYQNYLKFQLKFHPKEMKVLIIYNNI